MPLKLFLDACTLTTRHPFAIARGSSTGYRRCWIRLVDDEGVEGWGEADPSSYYGENYDTVVATLKKLEPYLPEDPFDLESAETRFAQVVPKNGAARAALSVALHDLVGKRLGQPLWRLWGLDPQKTPVSSFTIGIDTPDKMREKVHEASAYPILKIKLGTDRDEELLRTIRDATDKPIRVDANAGWTAAKALQMLPLLKEFGVELLEQPLPPDDLEGLARVRAAAGHLPVVVDESCLVARDIPRVAEAADGINIKLAKCGSLREALRMIATARALGIRVIGVVLGVDDGTPDRALKPVADAPDAEPALSPALLELGRWISRYYGTPLGLAMRALLPGALWGVRRPAGPAERVERVVTLAGALPSLLERERAFRRAPKRRAVYEALEALGGSAPLRHLRERLQLPAAAVDGLVRQGLARYERVARQRDPFADLSSPPPVTPTDDQRRVVAQVAALPADTPALIHGVTGSGKTLVYLEVLRRVVDDGRGAILLVPEIALTPQTVARVRGVFGDQVAVLHSGLSDGERADAWRALRSGARRVAVGARSAIFAPVPRLGAIVVDEEHEASYKQGTVPRYHARDAAAVRARLEGARLLLGSATPSLEALHWGETGRLRVFGLPERIGDRPLPPVDVVDVREAPRVPEAGAVPWTEALDGAVRGALERREQVILLLNRRGFATFLQCPSCGDVRECPRCAIALTVHRTPPALRCHYCGYEEPVPTTCRACGHETERMRGIGTEQLEHFLELRFPAARLARMDSDT